MPDNISKYYYREKEMRRIKALAEGDTLSWIYRSLERWVMGYGERPWRVIGTSLLIIGVFGFLYPFFGGIETEQVDTVAFTLLIPLSLPLGTVWCESFSRIYILAQSHSPPLDTAISSQLATPFSCWPSSSHSSAPS